MNIDDIKTNELITKIGDLIDNMSDDEFNSALEGAGINDYQRNDHSLRFVADYQDMFEELQVIKEELGRYQDHFEEIEDKHTPSERDDAVVRRSFKSKPQDRRSGSNPLSQAYTSTTHWLLTACEE